MTQENIKLIGTYVLGLVVLSFTGYMMATGREIPDFWVNLVGIAVGVLFVGNGVVQSVRRFKNNRRH